MRTICHMNMIVFTTIPLTMDQLATYTDAALSVQYTVLFLLLRTKLFLPIKTSMWGKKMKTGNGTGKHIGGTPSPAGS